MLLNSYSWAYMRLLPYALSDNWNNVLSTQNQFYQTIKRAFFHIAKVTFGCQYSYAVDFKTIITQATFCGRKVLIGFACVSVCFFLCHKLQKLCNISRHALQNCEACRVLNFAISFFFRNYGFCVIDIASDLLTYNSSSVMRLTTVFVNALRTLTTAHA